jgi:hypothetical protein
MPMKKLTPFLVILFLISPDFLLAQQALTGRVISSQGEVALLSTNGQRSRPSRGQPISVSDVLETGSNGTLQIRFSSGLIVSLDCSSSLQLTPGTNAGSRALNLTLQGGRLRLTNGDRNDVTHNLITDAGMLIIDVAGTDLAVAANPASGSLAAVYNGSVWARTNYGDMLLGAGGGFDFAALEPGNAPAGLQSLPAQFNRASDCS